MKEEKRGPDQAETFERVVLPHLDAAYNLARWLVRSTHDAEASGCSVSPPQEYASSFQPTLGRPPPPGFHRR